MSREFPDSFAKAVHGEIVVKGRTMFIHELVHKFLIIN